MCAGNSGRQQHHAQQEAERAYWREQDRVNAEAARKQEEQQRIAAERAAIAAAQEAQRQQWERQAQANANDNRASADVAATRQIEQMRRMKEQHEQRMAQVRNTGQALRSSMMILSQQGSAQAPTAQTEKRKRLDGGARSTTASLRMGATGSGSGSGANLSV